MIRQLVRELVCKLTGHDLLPATDRFRYCRSCHTFKDTSTS